MKNLLVALVLVFISQITFSQIFTKVTAGPVVNTLSNNKGSTWGDFDGDVKVEIYNSSGQKAAQLYDNIAIAGQPYQVKFGTEDLPAGIYLVVVQAFNQRIIRKIVLARQ